jgi:5'-nucleotidase
MNTGDLKSPEGNGSAVHQDKEIARQWNAMRGPNVWDDTVPFPVSEGKVTTKPAVVTKPIVGTHVPANFAGISNAKPVAKKAVSTDAPASSYSYTVKDGDTLWDIAVKVYGDGTQWTKVWDMNKDMLTKADARNATAPGHWIHTGQVVQVPDDSLNDH